MVVYFKSSFFLNTGVFGCKRPSEDAFAVARRCCVSIVLCFKIFFPF